MISTRVRIQGQYQEDLVFIEIPNVSFSTTVREFVDQVKAHPDVHDACSPLLFLGASLFRKALRENGDPNAEITHHLRIGQSLSSLGIRDEEELVMVCTTHSVEDAISRLFQQQDELMRFQREQSEATRRRQEELSRRQQEDTERLSNMMRNIFDLLTADRAERQRAMGGAEAWCNVGNAFASPATSIVNDNDETKQQCRVKALECFLKAHECDPQSSNAWNGLSTVLLPDDTVEVRGKAHTKQECCLKAVECDPQNSKSWSNLGDTLSAEETVEVAGEAYTKDQCFLKSHACDPTNSDAWNGLGTTLSAQQNTSSSSSSSEEKVINIANETYTASQCFLKAIECDARNAKPWFNLGAALINTTPQQQTIDVNNKPFTKQQCFVKAVECDPQNSNAWNGLGTTVGRDKTVVVDGISFTGQQCFINAIKCNPRDANGWSNIGTTFVSSQQSVDIIAGKAYTQQECLVKAIECNLDNPTSWGKLANILSVFQSVEIAGKRYTKYDCLRQFAEKGGQEKSSGDTSASSSSVRQREGKKL